MLINRSPERGSRRVFKVIALLLFLLLFVSGYKLLCYWENQHSLYSGESPVSDTGAFLNGIPGAQQKNEVETFLILGLDSEEASAREMAESYQNSIQADFLLLLVYDNTTGKICGLHINRDTVTDVPVLGIAGNVIDYTTCQIALAYNYGNGKEISCRNTANAISNLLYGISVDHYLAVWVDGISELNEMLGGVEITMDADYTEIDAAFRKGAKITLSGEQAEAFVRARGGLSNSTNLYRMERQKLYLQALYEKASKLYKEDSFFAESVATDLADKIVTDLPAARLSNILERYMEAGTPEILSLEGTAAVVDGYMEYTVDEEALRSLVFSLFCE